MACGQKHLDNLDNIVMDRQRMEYGSEAELLQQVKTLVFFCLFLHAKDFLRYTMSFRRCLSSAQEYVNYVKLRGWQEPFLFGGTEAMALFTPITR